jgi:hypothetical protein
MTRLHFVYTRARAALCVLLAVASVAAAQQPARFRPPAVPLVTNDPYFSAWSFADRLTDDWSKHWTGENYGMSGQARIDGKPYRFMAPSPGRAPAMTQVGLEVLPTRTVYEFEAGGVRLTLTFMSPLLPDDLDVLSRPVTYLTWDVRSSDGRAHQVQLYFDCSAEWVVNTPADKVFASRFDVAGLRALRFSSQEQPVLEKSGDDLRIDWGHLYAASPAAEDEVIADSGPARERFVDSGTLPDSDDLRGPRMASDGWPVLAFTWDLGPVGREPVSRFLVLAYDDVFSVEYFHRRLRPYWRRGGAGADELLRLAVRDYAALADRCRRFDEELTADLTAAGGGEYARLAALAFRQTIAAHKLVADLDGSPLFFSKENFSNGSIGTVDVTYPSSPFFLLFNTTLLKAQLTPVLDYAASPRWRFPFAPHDLGTYPLANGQTYGGGERSEENQMPVEECGNMLLMVAALAKADGDADYARRHWPVLTTWAEYLRDKGFDPENQLSTDDFAGHLAHNTNLSLKAILALGAYARLCEATGRRPDAATYRRLAEGMARRWVDAAKDGDHYRLAFDKPGTWSQKYNLVWDRLLGLNLFPAEVARAEVAYYRRQLDTYGFPLDNRSKYTKLDWEVWSATLAGSREELRALLLPLARFASESPSRVPLTDWYWVHDGKQAGFQARSVVGGIYIPLLGEPATWRKWSGRARPAPAGPRRSPAPDARDGRP